MMTEEERKKAFSASVSKYESKAYDKVMVSIRKDKGVSRADIHRAAELSGKSMNKFCQDAIVKAMADYGITKEAKDAALQTDKEGNDSGKSGTAES